MGSLPAPARLRTAFLVCPLGLDDPQPDLSWELPAGMQRGYQVQAASAARLLHAGRPDLWDSGQTGSDQSAGVHYGGEPASSRRRVHWRVRVWADGAPSPSPWSEPAWWEAGLLEPGDWSAQWIGYPVWERGRTPAALPVFLRDFVLDAEPGQARLYVAARGTYHATINGRPASAAVLEPPNTDFARRIGYAAHDVTALLRAGANTLAVELAPGLAHVAATPGRYQKLTRSDGPPRLLAQLEIRHADGTRTIVASDANWQASPGQVTFSDWWGGEDHDLRRAAPARDATRGTPVEVAGSVADGPGLSAHSAPGVTVGGSLPAQSVSQPRPGVYVADFGVNFAGWPQLRTAGPAGTIITMRPGELLAADGTVRQDGNGTGGPIWDTLTLSGSEVTWHPRFCYHGLRYLQLEGLAQAPDPAAITGLVLRAANKPAGSFACGSPLVNSVHAMIDQAIRSNMFSVLTDCPHREKLGWLEQAHLMFGPVAFGYDVAAYCREIVRVMADAQEPGGLVPSIAPEYAVLDEYRDDPNWGRAIIAVPWRMYREYGDTVTLRRYYPQMQRYLRYLDGRARGFVLDCGLGDWGQADGTSTPKGVTATYAYHQATDTLRQIAEVLGERGDAQRLAGRAENIAAAFRGAYRCDDGGYGTGSQACDALALDMAAPLPGERDRVLGHLIAGISGLGNHLNVGEIALPAVLRVLAGAGRDDVIWDVVTQTSYPSYGHLVACGATALPEYWNGPAGPGIASQNHFMLGTVGDWLTGYLAGLRQAPGSAGYAELEIAPFVPDGLDRASAEHRGVRGLAAVTWRREPGEFRLEAAVPGNTVATVRLPALAGLERVTAPAGAVPLAASPDGPAYRVGPGSWLFTARPGRC